MISECSFEFRFSNFTLDEGVFVTVLGIIDCAALCLNKRDCSSFFYSNTDTCGLCPAIYQDTSGLTPQAGAKYYSMKYANQGDNGLETVKVSRCETEPTYANQGAIRKRKLSKPGYPVVLEYECDGNAKEKYKYFSGPRESLCDDQGNWTLPAMFCVPTTCLTLLADSAGVETALYGGDTHHDNKGRMCQAWNVSTPHKVPAKFSLHGVCSACGSVDERANYCRDIGQRHGKVGCETMDPNKGFSYCDVPECEKERKCARPPILRGASAVKTELNGQKVHVTYKCHPDLKHISGGNVSICDMKTGVWKWPDLLCASEKCFYYDRDHWRKAIYIGSVGKTKNGRTCQRWDNQWPHNHKNKAENIPGTTRLSDIGNSCRDPDGEWLPWCLTTDSSKRWEHCAVPECSLYN